MKRLIFTTLSLFCVILAYGQTILPVSFYNVWNMERYPAGIFSTRDISKEQVIKEVNSKFDNFVAKLYTYPNGNTSVIIKRTDGIGYLQHWCKYANIEVRYAGARISCCEHYFVLQNKKEANKALKDLEKDLKDNSYRYLGKSLRGKQYAKGNVLFTIWTEEAEYSRYALCVSVYLNKNTMAVVKTTSSARCFYTR